MKSTTMLRQLLAGAQTVVAPGVFDGLSARLAARAGFPAVYATGGGIARSQVVNEFSAGSANSDLINLNRDNVEVCYKQILAITAPRNRLFFRLNSR